MAPTDSMKKLSDSTAPQKNHDVLFLIYSTIVDHNQEVDEGDQAILDSFRSNPSRNLADLILQKLEEQEDKEQQLDAKGKGNLILKTFGKISFSLDAHLLHFPHARIRLKFPRSPSNIPSPRASRLIESQDCRSIHQSWPTFIQIQIRPITEGIQDPAIPTKLVSNIGNYFSPLMDPSRNPCRHKNLCFQPRTSSMSKVL